jgi:integrase
MVSNYSKLRLTEDSSSRQFVQFYISNKRYRFSSGSALGSNLKPNLYEGEKRHKEALDLLALFKKHLDMGWNPAIIISNPSLIESLKAYSPPLELSPDYQTELIRSRDKLVKYISNQQWKDLKLEILNKGHISKYLERTTNNHSGFNHEKARVSSILGSLLDDLDLPNPCRNIKSKKVKPTLHKPFKDVNTLLEDIKAFNENLFLCCLFTYGCLLRPHQEIRNLKWGDFSEDMKHMSLSGKRNKSGRNRIVPLNPYILQYLHKGLDTDNIFTGSEKPFNKDYFKTLWSRYKAQSNVLEELQTLYSFRHSGAIEIYKRTGSLTILQQAMGHASLAVTLGYLRGLEIPSLKIEDMPRL